MAQQKGYEEDRKQGERDLKSHGVDDDDRDVAGEDQTQAGEGHGSEAKPGLCEAMGGSELAGRGQPGRRRENQRK